MNDDKEQVGFFCLVPHSQREQLCSAYTCMYNGYLFIQMICMLWKQKQAFLEL